MKKTLAFAILTLLFWQQPGFAQTPNATSSQPLTIIVPFAAGGSTDILARLIGDHLQSELQRAVVIQNVGGAGSMIGLSRLAKAKPDGSTIGIGTSAGMVINPLIKPRTVPYKPQSDFLPITRFTESYQVLVVNPAKVPVANIPELISYLKAHPKEVTFGSPGIGTNQQVAAEMLQVLTKTAMVHIPYTGSAQVSTDLVGGQIDLAFDQVPQLMPYIKSGQLRVLGYTGPESPSFDRSIPPIGSLVKGFSMIGWHGVFAPARTPDAVVQQYADIISKFMARPDTVAKFDSLGVIAASTSRQDFSRFLAADIERTRPVVDKAGMIEP